MTASGSHSLLRLSIILFACQYSLRIYLVSPNNILSSDHLTASRCSTYFLPELHQALQSGIWFHDGRDTGSGCIREKNIAQVLNLSHR